MCALREMSEAQDTLLYPSQTIPNQLLLRTRRTTGEKMTHFHRWATPSAQKVVPGEFCPANRTRPNRVRKVSPVRGNALIGKADCAMCGAKGVEVRAATDSNGARLTAYYYSQHKAPKIGEKA